MRLPRYSALVSLLLQLVTLSCWGQYYFTHYQVEDGLVHNSVASILQDSRGLVWIGTRGGLNRFDGYTFKACKNQENKFGSIGNNVIMVIAEDKKGMLWIGTGKGIFMYNPYSEVFTPLDIAPQTYIDYLLIDSNNNLWFLANHSLYKYDQGEKKVEHLKIRASCLALDRSMNLWVGSNDGVIGIYTHRTHSVTNVRIIDESVPANRRSISKIVPINDQEVLVGCFKQGLKSYNAKTGEIRSLPLRNINNTDIYVRDITAGSNQQYWIATESGIYIYDLATNTSQNLRKRAGDPYSIADNAVYTICKDNQGGMWAGTYFGGLNYYSAANARFEKYYPVQGANSISGDAVGTICADSRGDLWIGTEDAGINKFTIKTGQFTHYTATGKRGNISYPNIHGLLALGDQLFIGSFFHGMEIMDMRTGLVTDRFPFIGDKNDKVSDFILRFYFTKDSTLLVGTAYNGSGLFIYDRKHKTFSRIHQIPYNSYVFDVIEDEQGTIWTGSTTQGAFYYNPKTGGQGNFRFGDTLNSEIINEFPVHNIFEDSYHSIWFATAGGGLIKLAPDRKTIKKFTTANGLPSNVVFCILEDNSKHLWISSLSGLTCLDLRSEQCKTYTQPNGLITDQFNFNSAYKDVNGKMYFGSVKGMIAFNPAEFDQQDASPPIYITGFQINNKEIKPDDKGGPLTKSVLFTDTIVLAYDQNNFSIEFAALNYSSTGVTRYRYFMTGVNKDWTYLNTNRNAWFTDLGPGNYLFTVRAESNVGSWTSKERRLFIRILPPFWKSNTAYLLYTLTIGIILYLLIRYYHRYLDSKNRNKLQLFEHEKEKEIYQFKIDFFTNIAHEIQTPLTLIVGPVERLMNKVEDQPNIKKSLLMVQKNANRLADLTEQLLDFRQTEIEQFGLNFVNVDINKLLREQTDSFREFAQESGISLSIDLPEIHIVAFVDREALMKICGNLISNAIKYAASRATVRMASLTDGEEKITISFCNDGKGIPAEFHQKIFEPFFRLRNKEKPGTGIGLPLAKSLTELHNGSLTLVSGKTNEIIFVLTLPVHQKIEFNLSSNWKKV
ncbi:histidine kinase [Pseudoflavitalea sp. X16]|uniref:ligand-binding sensor domain-containing protein n=1 Tax=Paraflavitalea devenefica TaxID=2716334 RepID=UPI00141F1B4E|nr:sensor histidine kinase [Paraflavitalea devenefica]NII29177.1 histidine kinase [Paraflavitalea devenefica]